jgi:hypothetical protein
MVALAQHEEVEGLLEKISILSSEDQPLRNRSTVFMRQPAIPSGISLQILPEENRYDLNQLQEIVLGAIADYSFYIINPDHQTTVVKNARFRNGLNKDNTMLLDSLNRQLGEYINLQCIAIDESSLNFHFKSPVDVEKVKEIVDNSPGNYQSRLGLSSRLKRKTLEVGLENRVIAYLDGYNIKFPYMDLHKHDLFEDGLQASTELLIRVHQDRPFRSDIRVVNLNEYAPIFKVLFPQSFEDLITPTLNEIRESSSKGKIKVCEGLVPIKRDPEILRLDVSFDHIKYLLVDSKGDKIILKFGSYIDENVLSKILADENLYLGEIEKEEVVKKTVYQKGAGIGTKMIRKSIPYSPVKDSEGNNIASLFRQSINIPINQTEQGFSKAARLASNIYYNRIFNTAWLESADLPPADLTEVEKQVINAIDTPAKIYRIFLHRDDMRASFEGRQELRTPLEWVCDRMRESPDNSFEGRIYHTLRTLNDRITPGLHSEDFRIYGPDSPQLYSQLQRLLGRFEGIKRK